jgi:hypothetical protein
MMKRNGHKKEDDSHLKANFLSSVKCGLDPLEGPSTEFQYNACLVMVRVVSQKKEVVTQVQVQSTRYFPNKTTS